MKKSKTILVVIFFLGLVLGSSSAVQQIRTLEGRLAQKDAQVEMLTNQNRQLQSWLSGNATYYEAQLSSLQKLLEAANVTELQQKIERLEKEKAQLRVWLTGNITYYEGQVASLNNQVYILRQQVRTEVLGVYFSPKGGCAQQLVNWVNRANKSIYVLIYSFTLDSVSDALIAAHKRGVDVKVVFEEEQLGRYSEYEKLKAVGVEVRVDRNPALMHDKVMIIDGIIVFTGSFNWSLSAEEKNNENLIIIRSGYVAEIYEKEFEKIWSQSA